MGAILSSTCRANWRLEFRSRHHRDQHAPDRRDHADIARAFTDLNASLLQPQALTAANALAIRLTGIIASFLTLSILDSARLPARKPGLDGCG
jgi:hypothetical protein